MAIRYPYRLIRSKRKSIAVSIADDETLLVRIPTRLSDKQAIRFLDENEARIDALVARVKIRKAARPIYKDEEIPSLTAKAQAIIPAKVAQYANQMGVSPSGIKIGKAKKSFGSCTSKGILHFSCFLMLFPDEAIDYVVVHELAHMKEMNHSPRFYAIIQKTLPDYKAREAILKGTV